MTDNVVRVADVMRTTLHIVDGLSSVARAIAEMRRLGVSSLIIERRNADDEYGIVTVQDIAAKVLAHNRPAARTSVYEVMTKPALTLPAGMNAKYAIRLLAQLDLTRALVTRDAELIGLVTLRDLVVGHAGRTEPSA
jgi:signal-transduction protein with cAMP-binding, CBS, and nucleotidyltransferase domain